jgi:hypothetical protein
MDLSSFEYSQDFTVFLILRNQKIHHEIDMFAKRVSIINQ